MWIAEGMRALILHRDIAIGSAELAQHNCIVAELFEIKWDMLKR